MSQWKFFTCAACGRSERSNVPAKKYCGEEACRARRRKRSGGRKPTGRPSGKRSVFLSANEISEMSDDYNAGDSLGTIGRRIGRSADFVRRILAENGVRIRGTYER